MFMRIKVIHTVFQAPFTLGTVTELQIRIVFFSPAADCTAVMPNLNFLCIGSLHIGFEFLFSPNLGGTDLPVISGHKEEYDKIQQ